MRAKANEMMGACCVEQLASALDAVVDAHEPSTSVSDPPADIQVRLQKWYNSNIMCMVPAQNFLFLRASHDLYCMLWHMCTVHSQEAPVIARRKSSTFQKSWTFVHSNMSCQGQAC